MVFLLFLAIISAMIIYIRVRSIVVLFAIAKEAKVTQRPGSSDVGAAAVHLWKHTEKCGKIYHFIYTIFFRGIL